MIRAFFIKRFRKNPADPAGRSQRAQGLFEFALILPLLLLLMLGIIEVGRMLAIFSSVSSAAKQATRYGAVGGDSGNGMPYYQDCAGMRSRAKTTSLLQTLNDSDIVIQYDLGLITQTIGFCATSAVTPTLTTNIVDGDRVVISITTIYRPIVPIVPLPPLPMTFVAAHTIFTTIIGPTPTTPPNPDLIISKVGFPDHIVPAAGVSLALTYTIQITNAGPAAASGIIVTDTLPVGMNPISVTVVTSPTSNWVCPNPHPATSVFTCTLPFLGAFVGGNVAPPIVLHVTVPITPGAIYNVAQVGYNQIDPVTSNNVAIATTFIASWVDLEMHKIALVSPVAAGDLITYALTVNNNNWVDSGAMTVTDVLPTNAQFARWFADPSWSCAGSCAVSPLIFTRNTTLTVGSTSPTITVVLTATAANFVPNGGLVTNVATVTGSLSDPFPFNNSVVLTTPVTANADMEMFKSGPATVDSASKLNYVMHVTNLGTSVAASVRITDPLPAGTAYFSFSGTNWTCPTIGSTVGCLYGLNLNNGASTSDITLTVTPPDAAVTLVNTATGSSAGPDPDLTNNTATVTTTVTTCHLNQVDPGATHSPMNANPTSVGADSTSASLILVWLRDSCDNFVFSPPYDLQLVTLTSSRGGLDTITLDPAYSNPTGTGQVGFDVKSSTPGTSTYSAVAKNTVTNASVSLAATAQVTFVYDCVNLGNLPLGGSQQLLQFSVDNTSSSFTRHLTGVSLTWPQANGRHVTSWTMKATTLWNGNSNNNPFVIPASGLAWIAGTDAARTLNSGASSQTLQVNFNFNVVQNFTYNLTTTWDDGSGGHICTATTSVTH